MTFIPRNDYTNGVATPSGAELFSGAIDMMQAAANNQLNLAIDSPASWSTPQGQIAQSLAVERGYVNDFFAFMAAMFDPRTSSGVYQDGLAWLYFITRRPATATVVDVTCYGLNGTVIDTGARVTDVNNNVYALLSPITITGGSAVGSFQCETEGAIYTPIGVINQIFTTVVGWDSCINLTAGVTGRNAETQQEFEARRWDSVKVNGNGQLGTIYGRVAAVDGVTDCIVRENYSNLEYNEGGVHFLPHSIYVCVNGGSDADIANAILSSKSSGSNTNGDNSVTVNYLGQDFTVRFDRATVQSLYVRVKIAAALTIQGNADEIIKQAVVDSANGLNNQLRLTVGDSIVANRFTCYLQSVIPSVKLLDIDVSQDNVTWFDMTQFNYNKIPVVDVSTVTVMYV